MISVEKSVISDVFVWVFAGICYRSFTKVLTFLIYESRKPLQSLGFEFFCAILHVLFIFFCALRGS